MGRKSDPGPRVLGSVKKALRVPDEAVFGRRVRVTCEFKGKLSNYYGIGAPNKA